MLRKPLLAIAATLNAGMVCAQSSMTIFGVVDLALTRGIASGTGSVNKTGMTHSGHTTSRIGFRGVEDIGDGYSVGFWLEGSVLPNTGGAGSRSTEDNRSSVATSGLNFARRATVSLSGPFGEFRFGRDVTPSHWNVPTYDPFVSVGVGASAIVMGAITSSSTFTSNPALYGILPAGLGGSGPYLRASNMIQYFTPNTLGGWQVHSGYWFGHGIKDGSAGEDDGAGGAVRVSYTNGPFNGAVSYGRTRYDATPVATTPNAPTGDSEFWSVGGQWKFDAATVMAQYSYDVRHSEPVKATARGWLIGALIPVGVGQIRGSISEYRIDADAALEPGTRLFALGYVHHLSKRTALYTTVAHARNSGGGRFTVGGATLGPGIEKGRSNGVDIGLKHSF